MQATKKILIISDNFSELKKIKHALEKNNYTPLCATNGKQALELIKKQKPELIILNILMKSLKAQDILKIIKYKNENKTRLIYLTSEPVTEIDIEGADITIKKPSTLQKLIAVVQILTE